MDMDIDIKSLRPDPTIHKLLISTTSRLVGEYENDSILISHAWQHFSSSSVRAREVESPASRNAFVVAIRTESVEKKAGIVIPDYSHVGDIICAYLSVLFGKRFDFHGLTEGSGMFNAPDMSLYSSLCDHKLPFNSHSPRQCFSVPLDISHFSVLEDIFNGTELAPRFITKLQAACKFYLQALQNAEHEPEISYLHLITAGEIISGHFKYEAEELIDNDMLDSLKSIEDNIENGKKIARQIISRLFSVKRRFVKSLCSLVDDEFFNIDGKNPELGKLKANDFEKRISSAYDLRSKYVHTGVPFGKWIQPRPDNYDIQVGTPVVEDKEFKKILAMAPTFNGLERVIRYAILKFMASNGIESVESIRQKA
jgi:hypothetical protein